MKITTLMENKVKEGLDLHHEHGLSILIQVDNKKILFDLGQSGNFIQNAKSLDVNLKDLDYVTISHGHFDHSGGLERLIEEVNPEIKLYLGNGFFTPKYSLREDGEYAYLGNPFDENYLKEMEIDYNFVKDDITYLTEYLMIFTNFQRDEEFENTSPNMFLKQGEDYIKDEFLDEISLGVKTDKGILLIVGCSHVGILNIINTVEKRTGLNIYGLIGGTHLVKEDDEKINNIIDHLKEKEIQVIGACHCTGKQGETMLEQQMEEKFINNNTGHVLII